MELKDYLMNFVLAGVFIVMLFSFAITMGNNNDVNESMIDETIYNYSKIEDNVEETNAFAETWKESFTKDQFSTSSGTLTLVSIWGLIGGIFKLIGGALGSTFDLLIVVPANLFGIPPIIIGVIFLGLILGLITLAWYFLKQ